MKHKSDLEQPDPAAVLACAMSLHAACLQRAQAEPDLNLSDAYFGIDEFLRQLVRVANQFEVWACEHVVFEELGEVWPYYLEDYFGKAVLEIKTADALTQFDDPDCLRVALRMRLPVRD